MSGLKRMVLIATAAISPLLHGCGGGPIDPKIDPIKNPSISTVLSLDNYVDLKLSVNKKDIDNATYTLTKDGQTVDSGAISQDSYSKIFSYSTNQNITQGRYCINVSGGGISKDSCTDIPFYGIQVNESLNTNLNESEEKAFNLEGKLTSRNPELNPIHLVSVSQPGNAMGIASQGNIISVKASDNISEDTNYEIGMKVEGADGKTYDTKLGGKVYNLLDVSGFLEENETDSRQSGEVRVYKPDKTELGRISVSSQGIFNQQFPIRTSEMEVENILIQARAISGSQNKSYVRTLKIPSGDVTNKTMRVVLYDGLADNGISKEDFYRHFAEGLIPDEQKPNADALTWNPELVKWKNGAPDEIIVVKNNWQGSSQGFFSQETAETIKNRILDRNDIGAWFDGKITSSKVRIVDDYQYDTSKDQGKIVVYPTTNGSTGWLVNNNGYAEFGRPLIFSGSQGGIGPLAIVHELGHVAGLQGHARTLNPKFTIMIPGLGLDYTSAPRFADKKTAKALAEDTYQHGEGTGANGRLTLRDILGLNWVNWD